MKAILKRYLGEYPKDVPDTFIGRLKWVLFANSGPWQYGKCNDRPARKNKESGNVQFIIWKAGEHGHAEDCWIDFHKSHWSGFIPGA